MITPFLRRRVQGLGDPLGCVVVVTTDESLKRFRGRRPQGHVSLQQALDDWSDASADGRGQVRSRISVNLGVETRRFLVCLQTFTSMYAWHMSVGGAPDLRPYTRIGAAFLSAPPSLLEAARIDGASERQIMWHITLPLLKPGILAAWLLIFMACVRELGASAFLMGPNAKVIAPSIVSAFATSGTELTAAMALIQTFTVVLALIILFRVARGMTKELQ